MAAAAALDPRPEISLTTNGIGLARLAGRWPPPGWTG
jgi:molybdenum cofactor biosynthesis enzyme MoaA